MLATFTRGLSVPLCRSAAGGRRLDSLAELHTRLHLVSRGPRARHSRLRVPHELPLVSGERRLETGAAENSRNQMFFCVLSLFVGVATWSPGQSPRGGQILPTCTDVGCSCLEERIIWLANVTKVWYHHPQPRLLFPRENWSQNRKAIEWKTDWSYYDDHDAKSRKTI